MPIQDGPDAAGRFVPLLADGIDVPIGALLPGPADLLAGGGVGLHGPDGVVLPAPGAGLTAALEEARGRLVDHGFIAGPRGEPVGVVTAWDAPPLALVDRSAVRALGLRMTKVHLNAVVTDESGRPEAVWLARRSADRRMDPLHLDTTVAGGQPAGLTIAETLAMEAGEEAGMSPEMAGAAVETGRFVARYSGWEGLQHERLIAFELRVPPSFEPRCTDGEIAGFERVGLDRLDRMLTGEDRFKHASRLVLQAWRARG